MGRDRSRSRHKRRRRVTYSDSDDSRDRRREVRRKKERKRRRKRPRFFTSKSRKRDNRGARDKRSSKEKYGKEIVEDKEEQPEEEVIEKKMPCYVPSGVLAKFSNRVNGVILKFTEPMDAAPPNCLWQLFPFKDDHEFDVISLNTNSVFLFGKDDRIADILLENPTCSGQHAVVQFREVGKQEIDGSYLTFTKPYIMDLDSTNGTVLNGKKIDSQRYVELLEKDIIQFGLSDRKYVVMKDETVQYKREMFLRD